MTRRQGDKRRIRALRESATERPELRQPSSPRVFPEGPMSAAIKIVDKDIRELIDAAVAQRRPP